MIVVGMQFENSGNVIEVIDVAPGDTPNVQVRLIAIPLDGAIGDLGAEWWLSYRNLMAAWNPA